MIKIIRIGILFSYSFFMIWFLHFLIMPKILKIPEWSQEQIPAIVADVQKTEPSCRWPFQPLNSDFWWTYSVWPWTEDCSRIYYKDKLLRFWDERHVHWVKVYDWKVFAAVWDDLPWFPTTNWYWKLIMSDDNWKTRKTLLQNDRANFTAMRKIWEYYYFWEDAWIKKPTSWILKSKDLKTFTKVWTLPKWYEWNIVWWEYIDWKYWIWTFVDTKWMTPSLRSSNDWKKWKLEKDYWKASMDWLWVYRIRNINWKIDIAYNDWKKK